MRANRRMLCSRCTGQCLAFEMLTNCASSSCIARRQLTYQVSFVVVGRQCDVSPRAELHAMFDTARVGLGANTLNVFTYKRIIRFPKKQRILGTVQSVSSCCWDDFLTNKQSLCPVAVAVYITRDETQKRQFVFTFACLFSCVIWPNLMKILLVLIVRTAVTHSVCLSAFPVAPFLCCRYVWKHFKVF